MGGGGRQDESVQALKTTILSGWPDQREKAPVNIREHWNYRDELSVHNEVLFKGMRIIIPRILRPEVMSRIYASHQGNKSISEVEVSPY